MIIDNEMCNAIGVLTSVFLCLSITRVSPVVAVECGYHSVGGGLEHSGLPCTFGGCQFSVESGTLLREGECANHDGWLLDLRMAGIKELGQNAFIGMPSGLQSLYLGRNELSSVGAQDFEGLPTLRELRLDRNNISHIHSSALASLQSLTRLHVYCSSYEYSNSQCDKGSDNAYLPCTPMIAGRWEALQNYYGPRLCPCPAGYTGPDGDGQTLCYACPAGKFKSLAGSAACSNCDAGKHSSAAGAVSSGACAACASGTYSPQSAASSCSNCSRHSLSPAGSISAANCSCEPGFTGARSHSSLSSLHSCF